MHTYSPHSYFSTSPSSQQQEVKELAARARAGKLKPEEYTGGSFCVSNLGMFAVDEFSAILNPPQGAILAVGRARDVVRLGDGGVPVSSTAMTATISADARVVNEFQAAEWLQAFTTELENPVQNKWVIR